MIVLNKNGKKYFLKAKNGKKYVLKAKDSINFPQIKYTTSTGTVEFINNDSTVLSSDIKIKVSYNGNDYYTTAAEKIILNISYELVEVVFTLYEFTRNGETFSTDIQKTINVLRNQEYVNDFIYTFTDSGTYTISKKKGKSFVKGFEENGIQTIKMIQPDKYNGVKIEPIPYSAASEDIENFLSVDTSETVNLELKNVNSIDYIGAKAKNRISSIIDTTETVTKIDGDLGNVEQAYLPNLPFGDYFKNFDGTILLPNKYEKAFFDALKANPAAYGWYKEDYKNSFEATNSQGKTFPFGIFVYTDNYEYVDTIFGTSMPSYTDANDELHSLGIYQPMKTKYIEESSKYGPFDGLVSKEDIIAAIKSDKYADQSVFGEINFADYGSTNRHLEIQINEAVIGLAFARKDYTKPNSIKCVVPSNRIHRKVYDNALRFAVPINLFSNATGIPPLDISSTDKFTSNEYYIYPITMHGIRNEYRIRMYKDENTKILYAYKEHILDDGTYETYSVQDKFYTKIRE